MLSTFHKMEKIGISKHTKYLKDANVDRNVSIHEPIKRSKLKIFKHPISRTKPEAKHKMEAIKSDCLFQVKLAHRW